MSLSEILAKIAGVILLITGLIITLSSVGITLFGIPATIPNMWVGLCIGFLLLGTGIWIIRGGTITV